MAQSQGDDRHRRPNRLARGEDPGEQDPVRAVLDAAAVRRLEAEEDERLAALDALRTRDLAAVAGELLIRAERIEVGLADRRLAGRPTAVGADWLAVDTAGGEVDVALAACVWLRAADDGFSPPARAEAGGGAGRVPAAPAARTFRARLAQLELAGAPLDLGTASGALELSGRLVAAARDHVVLRELSGGLWHVAQVAWVRVRVGPDD